MLDAVSPLPVDLSTRIPARLRETFRSLDQWAEQAERLEAVANASCTTGFVDRANLSAAQSLIEEIRLEIVLLQELWPDNDAAESAGVVLALNDLCRVSSRLAWSWAMLQAATVTDPAGQ
jgi:hypothetical protein